MKNLDKRKALASRVLGVGKRKICFDEDRLGDVKEAITKQDIRDLHKEGIITVKPKSGRKKVEKRRTKRGPGKIKKKVKKRKTEYVRMVRKLRNYIKELKKHGTLEKEDYRDLRKKIRSRTFRDKSHLKEHIGGSK
jgi:large subunit ribosomal protein L19e